MSPPDRRELPHVALSRQAHDRHGLFRTDVDALDGRDIAIDGVGGRIEVIVPDGMDVDVRTQVAGGDSRVFDQRSDGFDVTQNGFLDGGDDVPDLSIHIDLVGGEILVREAA